MKPYRTRSLITGVLIVVLISMSWYSSCTESNHKETVKDSTKTSQHSAAFNQNISFLLQSYDKIKNSLVDSDSVTAKEEGKKFLGLVDSIQIEGDDLDTGKMELLKRQLNNIKTNAEALTQEENITEIRQDFRMISENLFSFFKAIKYEGPKLYWQNCPMAFGEGSEASWLSRKEEIINPYLGNFHPVYKGTMLHCGMVKDSIQ